MAKGILPDFCVGTGVATWVLGAVVAVRGVRASSGRVVLAVRTSDIHTDRRHNLDYMIGHRLRPPIILAVCWQRSGSAWPFTKVTETLDPSFRPLNERTSPGRWALLTTTRSSLRIATVAEPAMQIVPVHFIQSGSVIMTRL